jgi:hypothetical protein
MPEMRKWLSGEGVVFVSECVVTDMNRVSNGNYARESSFVKTDFQAAQAAFIFHRLAPVLYVGSDNG